MMTSKRLYFAMLGLIVLIGVAIIGSAYGTNKLLDKESQKLVAVKARLAAAKNQQTELTRSKKDIVTYDNLYKISKVIVPQSKEETQTVRQIVKLADANGVRLQSINLPASSLGGATVAVGSQATGTGAAGAAKAAAGGAGAALSQLTPVPTIPGVYKLGLVVTSSTDKNGLTSYANMIDFLAALEQNRLTALVSKIDITPVFPKDTVKTTTTSAGYAFVLNLDIYIKPGTK